MPSLKFIAWTAVIAIGAQIAFERYRAKAGR